MRACKAGDDDGCVHEEGDGDGDSEVSSRNGAPQKPDRPHTRAGVAMGTVVPEACSPNSPCTQRIGTGKLESNSAEE